MAKEKIKWHPAFAAAIQLEFKEYEKFLEYSVEHELTQEQLKIDVVIIKKLKEIEINKSVGKILRKYNIFEYKSPKDYISIDDYFKVKAYAYLYKVISEKTNSIGIEEITITLTCTKHPKKLIEYFKEKGIDVIKKETGIYYVENTDIATQLIVTKELAAEEESYLNLLQAEHKNENILSRWINDYINNSKNPLYEIIMDVLTVSNPEELLEVYKHMGIAKVSEGNKAFIMDIVKKLELDKKLKEEGKIEGKIEDAKNLLKLGVSIDIIIKAIGLSEEEILKIQKDLNH